VGVGVYHREMSWLKSSPRAEAQSEGWWGAGPLGIAHEQRGAIIEAPRHFQHVGSSVVDWWAAGENEVACEGESALGLQSISP